MKKALEFFVAFVLLVALVTGVTLIISNWFDRNRVGPLMKKVADLEKDNLIAKLELEGVRKAKDEEIAELQGTIDSAYTVIAERDEEINVLTDQVAEQSAASEALLTGEVQDLIDSSPPLKAYVFSLKNEIASRDALIFSLAQKDREKDVIIEAQGKQILAEREIGLSWKQQFENEQSLRIAQGSAFRAYRRAQNKSRLIWTAVGGGLGYLGGALSH